MSWLKSTRIPAAEETLPGRTDPVMVPGAHFVNGRPMGGPYPGQSASVTFGLGCFWGAERRFWETPGVWVTAAGYSGGTTPNPTYEEVCSGRTGHTEVVRVVYLPDELSLQDLMAVFWETHDPTQGMRQGNDVGTQYRSVVYVQSHDQYALAEQSREQYQGALAARGYGAITTEIAERSDFYFAEEYHQQYLAKNPDGYCGLGGTGVACPIGLPDVSSA
ncbi:MAG: peptide-methionine (S)-S-oxide reductase MsrA [Chromatiales bacterium]|jgi:peptide-methionine (S)-S-oxide reductase|nr:peptide-methionine (S)-S-oxide reductase MsrA [Chromatiales bacterium]MDH4030277.1 peptide-methionine (S)-S-oxide reductase MsrA [Chromatiales bacterium]